MNAVTAGFCRYGTYSIRHRLHRSVLYGGIDTVDSGVLIFIHRNDQTFLSVDDLGVNLSDFFRLDAQDDIVGLDGRDIFAIGISLRDRNGARLLKLLLSVFDLFYQLQLFFALSVGFHKLRVN